jgi:uncharacterized protein YciI
VADKRGRDSFASPSVHPEIRLVPRHATVLPLAFLLAFIPVPGRDARAQEDLLGQFPPMKTYALGLIRRGPAWTPERNAHTDSIQAGHMANIQRRFQEGWLQGAGPMLDGGDLRGIFIFSVDSVAQAEPLVATDPAVASRRLRVDLHPWMTFAGVSDDYRRRQAAGAPDSMVRKVFVILRRGPAPALEPHAEAKLQRAHLENNLRLVKEGKVVLVGPLLDDVDERGIFVMETADTAEARRWCDTDPKVRAGRLRAEIHPWLVARGVVPGH